LLRDVLDAALSQPHPTRELVRALNRYLLAVEHPSRLVHDVDIYPYMKEAA
jgi:hypothetical protein